MKKIAILIDGSNLHASLRGLDFTADYKKVISAFPGDVIRAMYFTAIRPAEETSTLRPMLDYLEYNGWTVVTKETRDFVNTDTGVTKTKGNMDIEIAVYALEIAAVVDELYFFSGDGDFRFLIETIQRRGVKVNVVSTIKTNPPMCADILRRQADQFIELKDIRESIARSREIWPKRNLTSITGSRE